VRTRTLEEMRAAGDLRWFSPVLTRLGALSSIADGSLAEFLAPDQPVLVARAPGRLDVMGGIADYSGSLVLELPLACATYAVAQTQRAPALEICSVRADGVFRFSMALEKILTGALREPDALAAWFAGHSGDRWASYIVGSVCRCLTLAGVSPSRGLRLLIFSDVPEGKGVSSSAALEVATIYAAAACYDLDLSGVDLALACQWAENHIAGAPCGVMDQMTSALGREDRLLRLACQPATVEGYVEVPAGYRFYGIDSGIRHAVTGSDYGAVRTAAFMGYRMIADMAGLRAVQLGSRVEMDDPYWGGYLANLTPTELNARFAHALPDRMLGAEFLAKYGGITDRVTHVEPDRWYPVSAATAHPIYEQDRVTRFIEVLERGAVDDDAASVLGMFMLHSHASYTVCGLGDEGTHRLVEMALMASPARGLFGAKITGGGSGGTVAILAREDAVGEVHHIARDYERETGRSAFVFDGSSPGAEELGVAVIPSGGP
jgi:L-arabinokinase